jgi:hypothetical protein
VLLEAYSPLGSVGAPQLSEPAVGFLRAGVSVWLTSRQVKKLAEKHGCTPAQVLISWQIARGTGMRCVTVPSYAELLCSGPAQVRYARTNRIELRRCDSRRLLVLTQYRTVIDLGKEDAQALEAASTAKPAHRTVLPTWGGVDIFEDGVKSKL